MSRHITSLYKPLLEELGLTYPQYLVMLVLWEHERVTVKELGHQLVLDSGTLTPLLKRLEQKGLLTRKRSGEDERKVEVSLTEAGKKMEQQASSVPDRLRQAVFIEPAELKQFEETLTKMMKHLPE